MDRAEAIKMGMPMRRGRLFEETDGQPGKTVVIVNQSFAAKYWPREDAVGKRIRLAQGDQQQPWLTVIGVCPLVRQNDPNRPDLERSVSTWDTPQILQFSYVYDLPFGRGRKFAGGMNPVLNGILGGWQINGTYRYTSGRPLHITLSGGQEIPTYSSDQRRPNLNGTLKRNTGPDFVDNYFANAQDVLSQPEDFTIGDAPRTITSARQPPTNNTTMSLFKQFSIREGMRLEFRAEAFNAFNHPQFCGPNNGTTSVSFDSSGKIDNTSNFAAITDTCINSREVQLALKFYW